MVCSVHFFVMLFKEGEISITNSETTKMDGWSFLLGWPSFRGKC